ncbi:MAG: TolC family protein [Phycisphaerales bacterium]|jgi:outer membrane protein TolC|nr:TolC family protein [Phycisphaerales bacterium]
MRRFCCFIVVLLTACDSGFQAIDRRVEGLIADANASVGSENNFLTVFSPETTSETSFKNPLPNTINPSFTELSLVSRDQIEESGLHETLKQRANEFEESATPLTLDQALEWAVQNAQEYRFAEYEYLSTTLSLLNELHLWGPRFFESIGVTADGDSTDGFYDTSLNVVHDFEITHRLPYGGSVSANALTTVAESLHSSTTNTTSKDSSLGVSLEMPLLRGYGTVARESIIQSRRDMIYSARTFERFRRSFFRSIVEDYLNLVVQRQSLANAQRGVDSLQQLANRQTALYESGRTRLYDSADAENQALASVARLSQSWERYRLAVDRFKVRIGWPIDDSVRIEPTFLGLKPVETSMSTAVTRALTFRLDLQNEYNKVDDALRRVKNAKNDIAPDLDFTASATLPTEENSIGGFDGRDVDYAVGLTFSVPLDRESQRISSRKSQILYERAKRSLRTLRESVAIEVRSSLRNIEVYQFTLNLQERNVEIAKLGLSSINADPDRVSVLDQTRAISELQNAQDARDSARRDLELSILDYLLQAGLLRIQQNGNMFRSGDLG